MLQVPSNIHEASVPPRSQSEFQQPLRPLTPKQRRYCINRRPQKVLLLREGLLKIIGKYEL